MTRQADAPEAVVRANVSFDEDPLVKASRSKQKSENVQNSGQKKEGNK